MKDRQPDSWWISKITDYRKCLRYGKLKHVDGVIEDSTGIDSEFGTAMHLGLNEILSGGNGVALFELYWKTVKHLPQDFKYGWNDLLEMGPVFLSRFERIHAKKFVPLRMEERLFGLLGSHKVEGTPDYLGDYDGVSACVDFKTSSSRYAKQMIQSHDQIPFYAHLSAQQMGFVPKKRVLYVFVKDRTAPCIQVLQNDLTSYELSETLENIKAEIDDYSTRKTFPRNPSSCVRGPLICPAFERCFGSKKNGE